MNDDGGHSNETHDYLPLSSRLSLAVFYVILFMGKEMTVAFVTQSNAFCCGVVSTVLLAYLLAFVTVMYEPFSSRGVSALFCVILYIGKSILDTFVLQSNASDCVAFASFLAAVLWTLVGLHFWRHVINIADFRSLDVVQMTTTARDKLDDITETTEEEMEGIEFDEKGVDGLTETIIHTSGMDVPDESCM